MDKRRTADLLHGEKVSPAYFQEQSRLRKRLDEYQKEQDRCLRKISNRQEILASACVTQTHPQTSKSQVMETCKMESSPRQRNSIFSKLDSGKCPEDMEIYRSQLRKLSVGSDTRYRKLSYPVDVKCKQKAIRQLSDPLEFSSQATLEKVIAFPKRKLTTGQIVVAVSSKASHPNSNRTDILKSDDFSRNQSRTGATLLSTKLPSKQASLSQLKSELEHSKINFVTRPSLRSNTQSRVFNETSDGEQSKYVKDSFKLASEELLCHRPNTSNENFSSFRGFPSVLNKETETLNRKAQNYFQEIAPGASVITKAQYENTELKAEKVESSGESSTGNNTSQSVYCNSEVNQASENEESRSNKNVFRRLSLSTDKSKRHLHEQTGATTTAGANKGVRYLGNAWSDKNTALRKISTVEPPEGIVINKHSSSLNKQNRNESSSSNERGRNFEALRNFRRLALVAVAAERFSSKNFKSRSEKSEIILPKRKLSSKARLEELQRPTESYLRQIVALESSSKTPMLKTRSRSVSGMNAGKTSASGITRFRRVSQAAMATRILIDRENRKAAASMCSDSRKEVDQGKTLAEMMDELKNCRYLRTSNLKVEHE